MNLEEKIFEELKSVYDPELGINVVDLGLIYSVGITEENDISITMTLTTPGWVRFRRGSLRDGYYFQARQQAPKLPNLQSRRQ